MAEPVDLAALGLSTGDGTAAAVAPPAEPVMDPVAVEPPEAPPELPVPPAEDEPIVVPEGAENPDAVRNAIAAERAKARESYKRAKDLERQFAEAAEAALPLQDRLTAATKRAQDAELKAMRLTVGVRNNLPIDLADRLRGDNEEELETDAKSLLGQLNIAPASSGATADGGFQTPPPSNISPEQAHGQFLAGILGRRQ